MIDVDVSVVTFDSARHLPRLLASLRAQTFDRKRLALTFVDNGSRDDSVACLERFAAAHGDEFGAVHIQRGDNVGFGAGHNRAASATSAPFLFVLNPDTELAPDTIAQLHAVAAGDDARVAAWEARQLPYEHPKHYDPVTLETGWCSGACVLFRRVAFDAVGGFDPAYFLYCEDVDLSWRLRAAGWRLRYVPRATVRHFTYAAPGEIKPAQLEGSTLGNLLLRTRFGTRRDVAQGLSAFVDLVAQAKGQRARLAVALARYARKASHFRNGNGATFRFYGWDYAPRRTGDFYESIASETLPRHPKVSILVRSIGRLPLLRRALTTIVHQTYAPIEVVLVEDGSDGARTLASEFPSLDLAYVPLPKRVGRSAAGNAALARATGDYCCFLDEDDELYADHVEQLVAALVTRGGRVAYASAFEVPSRIENDTLVEEGDAAVVFRGPLSHRRMMTNNQLPIQTVLFERALFAEVGGFDESLDAQEDWHLWARYLAHVGSFTFVDKTTSRYRVPLDRAQSETRRQWLEAERQKVQAMVATLRLDASLGASLPEAEDVAAAAPSPVGRLARRAYHGVRIAVRDFLFPER